MRIIIIASVLLLLAACSKKNPNYCPGVEDDNCTNVDAPVPCTTSSEDCVCLNPPGVCVQCKVDETRNCPMAAPACGEDNKCRVCVNNDECGAGACMEDGTCASPSQVIYAAPNGSNNGGCGTAVGQECSIAQALIEVSTARPIIRLATGTYSVTTLDGLDVAKSATLAARASTITRTAGTGPIITVRIGQTMKLIGGTLRGPNQDDGIQCNNGKVEIHEVTILDMNESGIEGDSCDLTVSRSTIRNNLQGGINMIGVAKVATITNNFVYRNGGAGSPIGGMVLRLVHPGSKLEFNTVVDNNAEIVAGTAGGIGCTAAGTGFEGPFNLIYRNVGGLDGMVQVFGLTCTFTDSFSQADPPSENLAGFERPTGANPSYRLTTASPVGTIRDARDCRDIVIDFEGDVRPQGTKCDLGADEFRMGQ